MKVLLVVNKDPADLKDGLDNFIVNLRNALRALDVVVKILLIDCSTSLNIPDSNSSDLIDFKVSLSKSFQTTTIEGSILDFACQVLGKSFDFLKTFNPDIIHCNDRQTYMPFKDMKNVIFSMHLPMPDLIGLNGLTDAWFHEYKIDKYALSNTISIVYSKFMRSRIWSSYAPGTSNIVLPLGIHKNSSNKLKIRPLPKIISFFGRYDRKQKGVDVFIELSKIFSSGCYSKYNLEFRLYGEGHIDDDSERYLKNNGFVTGKDLIEAYQETDIVIMPSRYEPFGLVGLEAMSYGCLLLATSGLGMDEYFWPNNNGIEIEANSRDAVNKLLYALENWNEMKSIIKKGYDDSELWSWEQSAIEHLAVYDALRNNNKSSLKLSGSMEYFKLKTHTQWSEENLKPFYNINVLEYLKKKCNLQKTVVWNPGIFEREHLKGVEIIDPYNDINLTLENLFLLKNNFETFVCIIGYEFTLDPVKAFQVLNKSSFQNLFLVFYRGERLEMQTVEFDNHLVLEKLLFNYRDVTYKSYDQLEVLYANKYN